MGSFPSGARRASIAGAILAAMALMTVGCSANRVEGAASEPPPPPPPPPPLPVVPPSPPPQAIVSTPIIRFVADSDVLSPDAKAALQQTAEQFRQLPGSRVEIRLPSPGRAASESALALLGRRSSAAVGYIAGLGVPVKAVDVVAVEVTRGFSLPSGGVKPRPPAKAVARPRQRAPSRAAAARMDVACPLGALGAMTGARVFPFPPPRPSTFDDLDPALFGPTATTFGDIERRLTGALRAAGYPARSYFATCGGFAMVTRVERVRSDGRPFPEPRRFVSMEGTHSTVEEFSLAGIIRALTSVEGARFRVIVFLVTDQLIAFSAAPVDAAQAERWVIRGNTNLAPSISRATLPRTYFAKALIYEFRKTTAGAVFVETTTPALAQLRSANIRIGATR